MNNELITLHMSLRCPSGYAEVVNNLIRKSVIMGEYVQLTYAIAEVDKNIINASYSVKGHFSACMQIKSALA